MPPETAEIWGAISARSRRVAAWSSGTYDSVSAARPELAFERGSKCATRHHVGTSNPGWTDEHGATATMPAFTARRHQTTAKMPAFIARRHTEEIHRQSTSAHAHGAWYDHQFTWATPAAPGTSTSFHISYEARRH